MKNATCIINFFDENQLTYFSVGEYNFGLLSVRDKLLNTEEADFDQVRGVVS